MAAWLQRFVMPFLLMACMSTTVAAFDGQSIGWVLGADEIDLPEPILLQFNHFMVISLPEQVAFATPSINDVISVHVLQNIVAVSLIDNPDLLTEKPKIALSITLASSRVIACRFEILEPSEEPRYNVVQVKYENSAPELGCDEALDAWFRGDFHLLKPELKVKLDREMAKRDEKIRVDVMLPDQGEPLKRDSGARRFALMSSWRFGSYVYALVRSKRADKSLFEVVHVSLVRGETTLPLESLQWYIKPNGMVVRFDMSLIDQYPLFDLKICRANSSCDLVQISGAEQR